MAGLVYATEPHNALGFSEEARFGFDSTEVAELVYESRYS
jgi:hypothetical protein